MTRKNIPLALAVLTLSASALAVDVDVKFRADIIQPTCDIKLEGTNTVRAAQAKSFLPSRQRKKPVSRG